MTHIESRLLKADIIADAKNGMTITELSEKYKRTNDYIYNVCQWSDVRVKRANVGIVKFNTFLILTELFNTHKTMSQIAEEFGVSHQRISQIYKKAKEAKIPGLPKR